MCRPIQQPPVLRYGVYRTQSSNRGEQGAQEKIQEYINHRRQQEDQIIQVVTEMHKSADVVKAIYAHYPPSLWPATERVVLQHLDKLKDEGRAQDVGSGKWILRLAYK
jgi:Beta-lactamase associated winged helix domain